MDPAVRRHAYTCMERTCRRRRCTTATTRPEMARQLASYASLLLASLFFWKRSRKGCRAVDEAAVKG